MSGPSRVGLFVWGRGIVPMRRFRLISRGAVIDVS